MTRVHVLMALASVLWLVGAAIGSSFIALTGFAGMTVTLLRRVFQF